jgi:spermidine synthase
LLSTQSAATSEWHGRKGPPECSSTSIQPLRLATVPHRLCEPPRLCQRIERCRRRLRRGARTRNNTSGAFFILKISLIAILEGFSTLAVEVIAIRLATPVAGSSMTLTGVMLGIVLFALSAGYWRGGELSSKKDGSRIQTAVARNLLAAGTIYAALSFPLEAKLLEKLLDGGLTLGLAIGMTATVLFVLPVYLASQTVPMLAELTNTEGKAGKASGKILFFSTLGSVAGGILTPIFLFPTVGVRASTYVVCGLLVGGAGMVMAGRVRHRSLISVTTFLAAVSLARAVNQGNYRFSFDSPHQSIRIVEEKDAGGRVRRVMYLNGGRASGIYADTGQTSFRYVREADQALAASRSESVLAVGAAGFTFPRDAAGMPFVKQVDAVDVDSEVLRIAEQHFLLAPVPQKVRFFPLSARGALRQFRQQGRRYGLTLLDAYSGRGIPEELLTIEFFSEVRSVSDRVAANIIMDPEAESEFARNVLASFRQVFGHVWVKDTDPNADSDVSNVMVTNWDLGGSAEWHGQGRIYTDDRNSGDRDHVKMMWDPTD